VKVTFWLLDINSESRNGKAELWLWGIDDKGNRCLVIDRNYVDYFYAVVEEGFDASNGAEVFQPTDSRATVQFAQASVYCGNPSDTAKLARTLRTFEGVK